VNEQELKRLKDVCRRVWRQMIEEWMRGKVGRVDEDWVFEEAQDQIYTELFPDGAWEELSDDEQNEIGELYCEEWDRFQKEFA